MNRLHDYSTTGGVCLLMGGRLIITKKEKDGAKKGTVLFGSQSNNRDTDVKIITLILVYIKGNTEFFRKIVP